MENLIKELSKNLNKENFKQNKENLLNEIEISASRLNTFLNSKSKFILSYIFNIRYCNSKMISGKIAEEMLKFPYLEDYDVLNNYNKAKEKEMFFLEEEEQDAEEIQDLIKAKDVIKEIQDKFLINKEIIFDNEKFLVNIGDRKIYYIPDLILKNNTYYELVEIKYTKRIPNENNIYLSHVRQLLLYNTLIKYSNNINNIKNYLLYISPKKYKIYEINNVNFMNISHLNNLIEYYINFIKNLKLKYLKIILENEIDSFYIGDVEKELIKNFLKKDINNFHISEIVFDS